MAAAAATPVVGATVLPRLAAVAELGPDGGGMPLAPS
jgi:hypothetical protein